MAAIWSSERKLLLSQSRYIRSLPTWLRTNQYQKFRSLPKLFQAPEMAAIRPKGAIGRLFKDEIFDQKSSHFKPDHIQVLGAYKIVIQYK